MNTKKIGELIKKLRKEKGLSQQELADKLMVSPKTVSKWECSNGLPDITILKNLSEVLGVTIDELLDGNQNNKEQNKKKSKVLLIVIICIILLIIIIFFMLKQNNISNKVEYNCEVIRTFHIDKIKNSNNQNYLYITVSEYQVEGTYTIKMSKTISKDLTEDSNYEFTFKTTEEYVKDSVDNLYENSEIINVSETDKVGMEQRNHYICN